MSYMPSRASIATLVRVPYAKELVGQSDYLYDFVPLATWSTIEVGTALTASSLATLKPLFRKFGAIFTTTNGATYWTRASRRQSAVAKIGHSVKRLPRYSGRYASRKGSLASGASEGNMPSPIAYPMPAKWPYANCNDDIEMVANSSRDSKDNL